MTFDSDNLSGLMYYSWFMKQLFIS